MKRRAHSRATSFRIVLRDALCGVMAEELADRILGDALRRAKLARVPADVEEVAAFAGGALREEIEALLDASVAESVAAALEPVLAAARSGVQRRRSVPKQPAGGTPLARIAVRRRVVLVCTDASTEPQAFRALLATRVSLDVCATLADLAAVADSGNVALLVVDLAGLPPEEVARVLMRAPAPGAALIRGGGAGALGLAGTLRARGIRCTVLPPETSSENLADACRSMLGNARGKP